MKAYKICDLKNFMNKLLLSDCFDCFLLEEGTIVTAYTFRIDGRIQKDFFTKEEQTEGSYCLYEFTPWKEIRPVCFHLIKGKRTPLLVKFVLLLQPQHRETILAAGGFQDNSNLINSFTLTIKYDGTSAVLITGISTTSFLMDKTPEQLWDAALWKFLLKNELDAEQI